MDRDDVIEISTTSDQQDTLIVIIDELLQKQLAACCQLCGEIGSYYRWKGQVEASREWECKIKTVGQHWPAVRDTILRLHHYEEPQIIVVPIIDGSDSYLKWIRSETAVDR